MPLSDQEENEEQPYPGEQAPRPSTIDHEGAKEDEQPVVIETEDYRK
tara:strand:- start:62 stop:202 length:141 start_codon:yes stop_codon:yes gene_type:complete